MSKPSHIGTIHENIKRQEGQHSLSLSRKVRESDFSAPLPEAFDLDALAAVLHLDADEAAWFSAIHLDAMSRTDALLNRLGWDVIRGDRVRKRVNRKLSRYRRDTDRASFDPDQFVIRGSSLRMCYEERLPSGRACWTMVQVDQGFEATMATERAELFGDRQRLLAKARTIAA